MENEPRGLLRDTDFLGKLHRGNPFAGGNKQVHGIKPLVKGNVGPLKDGASPHGEVQLASVAAVEAILAGSNALSALACRAVHAIGPHAALKVGAGGRFIREDFKQLERAYR